MVQRYRTAEAVKRLRLSGSILKHPEKSHPGNANGKRGGAKPGNANGKRGGLRDPNNPGGRPLGLPNMKSREIIAKAKEGGELPHEFLLRIMRSSVGEEVSGGHKVDWEDIKFAAVGCINYYAPKLSSVNVSGKSPVMQVLHVDPDILQRCSIEELKVLEKVFGRLEEQGTEQPDLSLIDATPYSDTLQ